MMQELELRVARRRWLLILGLHSLSFILPVNVSESGLQRGYVYFFEGLKYLKSLGVGVDEGSVVAPAWFANFVFWYGCLALYQGRWRAAGWAGFLASFPSLLCGWVLMQDMYDHDSHPGLGFYLWLSSMVLLMLVGIHGSRKFAVPKARLSPDAAF
jgi:hypothetical protein